MLALVLGGGNALGAYHGGIVEALAEAEVWPEWVAGSSIGAIMGALIAGNPPERRVAAIREFWARGALRDPGASWLPDALRKPVHLSAAIQARLTGRPRLYHLRIGELLGGDGNPGLYDPAPMRRALESLVDFERLNRGSVRLSLMTVDVETGAEVSFDTAHERLTVDHLLASAALIPDFPPVRIGDRLLVDGGLASNVPVELVLGERPETPLTCFSVDPFPLVAPRPVRLADAAERQTDLSFAVQTTRTLRAMRCLWEQRGAGPAGAVYCLNYRHLEEEVALKTYDFAQSSLDRRWAEGRRDMVRALLVWRAAPPAGAGLQLYDIAAVPETV